LKVPEDPPPDRPISASGLGGRGVETVAFNPEEVTHGTRDNLTMLVEKERLN